MKIKTIGLTVALCFVAGAACFADDPQMGTWKLNECKSKLTPGEGKNTSVAYEAAGDQVIGRRLDELFQVPMELPDQEIHVDR